ncbi:MAG: 23S rRNA (pseudouridine(1915)-N(3))-methyltransferase RlmH [Hyphomicrobiaceae bacterium]
MRLAIVAVGRLKEAAERTLVERYCGLLRTTGRDFGLGPVEVREVARSRGPSAAGRKAEEAERLLKSAQGTGLIVALDERGRSLTSAAFAGLLGARRDEGLAAAAFLVGGPDGHGPAVLDRADVTLSLGTMTLPHGLARVVLAEQLYRAAAILAGHPYHRA